MVTLLNIILSFCLTIQIQYTIIRYLLTWIFFGKPSFDKFYEEPVKYYYYDDAISKQYQKLQVDAMPLIDPFEKLDYTKLLKEYLAKHGKPLKPISRRKNSLPVPDNISCPRCNAPHYYIYRNNGKAKNTQYRCKVCNFIFGNKTDYLKNIALRCPHCKRVLEKIKKRKNFNLFKCKNPQCSFYLSNLKNLSPTERKLYAKEPGRFKLHYIYRDFVINFRPLSKESPVMPDVDLSKIHSSPYVLGLVLITSTSSLMATLFTSWLNISSPAMVFTLMFPKSSVLLMKTQSLRNIDL